MVVAKRLDDPVMYRDTRILPQVQTCNTANLQTCGAMLQILRSTPRPVDLKS